MSINPLSINTISQTYSTQAISTQTISEENNLNQIQTVEATPNNQIINSIELFNERIFKGSEELKGLSSEEMIAYIREKMIDTNMDKYDSRAGEFLYTRVYDPEKASEKTGDREWEVGPVWIPNSLNNFVDKEADDSFMTDVIIREAFLRDQITNTFDGERENLYLQELEKAYKSTTDYYVNKLTEDISDFFNGTSNYLWSGRDTYYLKDLNFTIFDGIHYPNNPEQIRNDKYNFIPWQYEQDSKAQVKNVLNKADFSPEIFRANLHELLEYNRINFQQLKNDSIEEWNTYVTTGKYSADFKVTLKTNLDKLSANNINLDENRSLENMSYSDIKGVSEIIRTLAEDYSTIGNEFFVTDALKFGMIKAKKNLLLDVIGLHSDIKEKMSETIDRNLNIKFTSYMRSLNLQIDLYCEREFDKYKKMGRLEEAEDIMRKKEHQLKLIAFTMQKTMISMSDAIKNIAANFLKVINDLTKITQSDDFFMEDLSPEEIKNAKVNRQNLLEKEANASAEKWNKLIDKYFSTDKEKYYLPTKDISVIKITV